MTDRYASQYPGPTPAEREPAPDRRAGGEDLQFLDLEISKVLTSEAGRIARRALHDALARRIAARLETRWSDRLDALADHAAAELVADLEANLDVEARIRQRGKARREHAAAVWARFGQDDPLESDD
jgi:hypothetical protein